MKDFIPHKYITALQQEIADAIDKQARKLLAEGKITQLHEDKDYLHRTDAIWEECPEIWSPVYSGNHAGKAMFELLSCDEMLDIMEQLVGPEIIAAGIYRLRPKLPRRLEGIVPWHQVRQCPQGRRGSVARLCGWVAHLMGVSGRWVLWPMRGRSCRTSSTAGSRVCDDCVGAADGGDGGDGSDAGAAEVAPAWRASPLQCQRQSSGSHGAPRPLS